MVLVGAKTHVSVFLKFLEGKYDAELKWPFIGKVTIALLNQAVDKYHHEITANISNTINVNAGTKNDICGYSRFIAHSELTSKSYLKDDTLYFRVLVQATDHKPWLECTTLS